MMKADNGQMWAQRGQALLNVLETYGLSMNARYPRSKVEINAPAQLQPSEEEQDLSNLQVLSQALQQFAQKQWNFFLDGFFSRQNYHLNESREFPPMYVMSVISSQIGEDLELIRRVVDQRTSADLRPALRRADRLIWRALEPAVGALIKEEAMPVPMGYFQKAAAVRIIPYARVALIGIPFTATQVNRDYLAIPHEAGHYVYRNGRIDGEQPIPPTLGQKLLDPVAPGGPSPRYVRRWKEEIFADVYGCMVSGPEVALSFFDLMRQTSRSPVLQTPAELLYGQFTEDDGVHPVPALRPFVYTRVLARDGWGDLVQRLDEEWRKELADNGVTEFRTRYLGPSPDYISLSDGEKALAAAVDQVYDLIKKSGLGEPKWSSHARNNPNPTDDELYVDFDRFIASVDQGSIPVETLAAEDNIWENWVSREGLFPGLPGQQPPRQPIPIEPGKAQRIEELELEPRYTWNHVFLAGGWSTRVGGAHGTGVVLPKSWRDQGSGGGGAGGY